ncbi:MAG: hypothetical protein QOG49_621 [Frankiaceae bacterium]|jgi:hypothetical protein|nr:hypothetical protein [Frankiaceae bacterium]
MMTQDFIAAELAYRIERLSHLAAARPVRKPRRPRLPVVSRRERLEVRPLAGG